MFIIIDFEDGFSRIADRCAAYVYLKKGSIKIVEELII